MLNYEIVCPGMAASVPAVKGSNQDEGWLT